MLGPEAAHTPQSFLSLTPLCAGQVVMTIIVAFILEAFVFRMNFSRKNQDSEGLCKEQEHPLPAAPLSVRLAVRLAVSLWAAWHLSLCMGLVFLALSFPLIIRCLTRDTCS